MRPVTDKRDFVERYKDGEFGNAGPTWSSVSEFLESVKDSQSKQKGKLFHLRNKIPGGPTYYDLSLEELGHTVADLNLSLNNFYVSEMAPTARTILQGEVRRSTDYLELRGSRVRKPMRAALVEGEFIISGLAAKLALQSALNAVSYDWLNYLLDSYDDHIIEFSAYEVCWGTLPGYNTVFWEVRPDRKFASSLSKFTEVY